MASNEGTKIPVINLSSKDAGSQLLEAASNNGFMFVEHTNELDLSPDQVNSMFKSSHELFDTPAKVKADYAINSAKSGKNHGYLGPGTENLDPEKKRADQKEAFNIGPFNPTTHQSRTNQPLPPPLDARTNQLSHFMAGCHALCNRILTLLATALRMPDEAWFADRHKYGSENSSILRLLYYPGLKEGVAVDEDIRAGAHSDYGSVTLLFRLPGQPGLELLTKEGRWVGVPVNPRATSNGVAANGSNGQESTGTPILVNIGDVLEYWTNGLLKSTVHRVVFPATTKGGDGERYSMAYFCHPDDDVELVEVPSPVVQAATAQSKVDVKPVEGVRTAKDHLNARLAATYGVK